MPIDISEYLNLVRTGSKVNTVRGAVADASEAIARYKITDSINPELETIRTGVYGRDIRAAIYSALDKLSKTEGGTAVAVYDNWAGVADPCLMGFVTNEWGTLPYRLVEYIKNSGNYDQVILTDILPRHTDKIEINMQFGAATGLSNNRPFFGVVGTKFAYYSSLWVDSTNTWNTMSVYNHFNYVEGQSSNVFNVASTIKYQGNNPRQIFTLSNGTATWGSDSISFSGQINPNYSDVQSPIAFFGLERLGTITTFNEFELMIYGVKLYDTNNVLLCDLRPAERKSDYELGLYDVVTGKFYGNSGTGTFERGKYLLQ